MSELMQGLEIETVLTKARDLIEAGTETFEQESTLQWNIIGALCHHVTRGQFNEIMVNVLHEATESMLYVPKDEEDGDWND